MRGQSGAFPGGAGAKNPPANSGDTRDAGSIPGPGRSPGGGNVNPLQHSFFFFFSFNENTETLIGSESHLSRTWAVHSSL